MATKRQIPYGYTVQNGITVIDEHEANIVRAIFNDYITGMSLLCVAENLSLKNIKYTENICEWDKAKVSRILNNKKYIGDDNYPAIIEIDIFNKAIKCKLSRRCYNPKNSNKIITQLASKIRCKHCGMPMIRQISDIHKIRESWICSNKDCKNEIRISDGFLIKKVNIGIDRINDRKHYYDLLEKESQSVTMIKLKNEISNESIKDHPDEEIIIDKIKQLASELYGNRKSIQKNVEKRTGTSAIKDFDTQTFNNLIEHINLDRNGNIQLITKTQ